MSENEVSFSKIPTEQQAIQYVRQTLEDGELSCKIKWGFDERQADPFHKSWSQAYLKRCLEILIQGR